MWWYFSLCSQLALTYCISPVNYNFKTFHLFSIQFHPAIKPHKQKRKSSKSEYSWRVNITEGAILHIHFVTQIQLHAVWMQILQLCTHDVIIISSVNNERVQLHTNRKVPSARDCTWMESRLMRACCSSRIIWLPSVQQGLDHVFHTKEKSYIQSHGWDYRTSRAYRREAVTSVGVRGHPPRGNIFVSRGKYISLVQFGFKRLAEISCLYRTTNGLWHSDLSGDQCGCINDSLTSL